jgi:hypothetical protein
MMSKILADYKLIWIIAIVAMIGVPIFGKYREPRSMSTGGSCTPIAVPIKVEAGTKTITHKGKAYQITIKTYRVETDVFAATWIEEGDPAYEIELRDKKKNTQCRMKSDLPFIESDGNIIYQAHNGDVIVMEQGIASIYRIAIIETATCKLIGHIDDLYPQPSSADEIPATVHIGPNSSITVGPKTYQLGDKCIPTLDNSSKSESTDRKK